MRFLLPLVLIIASALAFFSVIKPLYQDVLEERTRVTSLNVMLANSKEILELRDSLRERFNAIPSDKLEKLDILLPASVDNVRLILEIDRLATDRGLTFEDVDLEKSFDARSAGGRLGPTEKPYNEARIRFVLIGSYEDFKGFLSDLERSLRIIDLDSLSFDADREDGSGSILNRDFRYEFTVKTYWQK